MSIHLILTETWIKTRLTVSLRSSKIISLKNRLETGELIEKIGIKEGKKR